MTNAFTYEGRGIVIVLAAVLGIVAGVPYATADISDVVFRIEAQNVSGAGVYEVTEADGSWDGDTFVWALDAPVQIMGGAEVIATLSEGSLAVVQDPQVNLSFAVQAGTVDTSFSISSALLSFDPITGAEGRASAAFSVTDFFGGGTTLIGLGPNGGSFLAQYNDYVPYGTPFCEVINGIDAPSGGSETSSVNVPEDGFNAIPGSIGNISTRVWFNVTANGLASGTTVFEVVPEPGSGMLLMLAAGLGLIKRRF